MKNCKFIIICLILVLQDLCFFPTTLYAASGSKKSVESYKKVLKSESGLQNVLAWNEYGIYAWEDNNQASYKIEKEHAIKSKFMVCSKKNKKAYYTGTGYLFGGGGFTETPIFKVSYKGNKVTIKGVLIKSPSFGKRGSRLKNKSRIFKMTKKCKYYYINGLGRSKLSKKEFFKKVNKDYMFTGFNIYTNSNGKIYQMCVDYSM